MDPLRAEELGAAAPPVVAQDAARRLLGVLAERGIPPGRSEGDEAKLLRFITVGAENLIQTFVREDLDGLLAEGGSLFRLIVGSYGEGKTHLLQLLETEALERGFAVARLDLVGREAHLDDLLELTRAFASSVRIQGSEPGIPGLLDAIVAGFEDCNSVGGATADLHRLVGQGHILDSVARAFEQAMKVRLFSPESPLRMALDDYLRATPVAASSLSSEIRRDYQRATGLRPSKRNAPQFLRSLTTACSALGIKGCLVLLDEVGQDLSWGKRPVPVTLRQLVDRLALHEMPRVGIIYAVLPEFDEVLVREYVALSQRLRSPQSDASNPRGTVVRLADLRAVLGNTHSLYTQLRAKLEWIARMAGMRLGPATLDRSRECVNHWGGQLGASIRGLVRELATIFLQEGLVDG